MNRKPRTGKKRYLGRSIAALAAMAGVIFGAMEFNGSALSRAFSLQKNITESQLEVSCEEQDGSKYGHLQFKEIREKRETANIAPEISKDKNGVLSFKIPSQYVNESSLREIGNVLLDLECGPRSNTYTSPINVTRQYNNPKEHLVSQEIDFDCNDFSESKRQLGRTDNIKPYQPPMIQVDKQSNRVHIRVSTPKFALPLKQKDFARIAKQEMINPENGMLPYICNKLTDPQASRSL